MKYFFLLSLCLLLSLPAFSQVLDNSVPEPFVIGETREISSVILDEARTLNIYLPPGYHDQDTATYPVIYLLDGSADEDFIHVAGLLQYFNFSWINLEPQSIIVGIANVDRERDFTFPTTIAKDKIDFPTTGSSGNFIAFIESELQPFINATYRANNERTLIGQSLGGLLATEVLFKKPGLFSRYIIISPSLWWDEESLFKNMPAAESFKCLSVYVGVGKEGKVMEKDAKALYSRLKKTKQLKQLEFGFYPDKNHATIYHEALMRAFEVLE